MLPAAFFDSDTENPGAFRELLGILRKQRLVSKSIVFCFFRITCVFSGLVVRAAGMVLDVLQDLALGGDGVGEDADDPGHEAHHQEGAAQDQGLDMALGVPLEEEDQEADADDQARGEGDAAQDREEGQGLVKDIGPEDRQDGFLDIAAHGVEQAGGAELAVGADVHRFHRDLFPAGLDDGLQGVGVFVGHVQAQGGLPAQGAEAAGGVRDRGLGSPADHPGAEVLEFLFQGGEVLRLVDGPGADDDIALPFQDRADQGLDVLPVILVVRVRVHDDVRAVAQAGVQAGHEAGGQAPVLAEVHDIVDAPAAGHLLGVVQGAVVDDQVLDGVDPVDVLRQVVQGNLEGLRLVQAGDLDDQLHKISLQEIFKFRIMNSEFRIIYSLSKHVGKGRKGKRE